MVRCGHKFAGDTCPVCLLEAPLPLGHFEIKEEIGRGGMGVVFRAIDTRIDRDCAIKLLERNAEAKALAKLQHENIVTLYEAGEVDGQPYLAMELIESPRPPSTLSHCIDVACALEAAHREGVVHGDVKPDNVLVTKDGRAKLTDFGIARIQNEASGFTGAIVGTPRYIAPEVAKGDKPTPQADIFALGVMIQEICAPLKWPLDGIVRRATAHDPIQRYESAAELREALHQAKSAMQAGTLPPEERTWLRAVALLFAAASGLALWALLQSISPIVLTQGNEVYALVRLVTRTLPDGRIVSYARLEIAETLAAIAAFALAAGAYGLLRQHWRRSGLEDPRPNRPLKESKHVFFVGVACVAVFVIRRLLINAGETLATLYVPVVGGLSELLMLYLLWTALLEAQRTSRPLTKEWLMWLGVWLALLPPAIELLTYIRQL